MNEKHQEFSINLSDLIIQISGKTGCPDEWSRQEIVLMTDTRTGCDEKNISDVNPASGCRNGTSLQWNKAPNQKSALVRHILTKVIGFPSISGI